MKLTINFFISASFIVLILFSSACKKSSDNPTATNTAVIKLNGAQPNIDSVTSASYASNGAIYAINVWAYIHSNSLSYCKILLKISPSDPLYASGSVIDLASSPVAIVTYMGSGNMYGDPYQDLNGPPGSLLGGNGTITITKNDFNNRRIEGTLTNCVVTNPGNTNDKVTIEGNFAVTYPAP